MSPNKSDREAQGAGRDAGQHACEKVFTFGLWGCAPGRYEGGHEGLLRQMRRLSMNCLVCAPAVGTGEEELAEAKQRIALYRRYGVYVLPHCSGGLGVFRSAAEALKDETNVLAWYIRDEPNPDFVPEFLEYKRALEEAAPGQPAVCLFYRPDSVLAFSPHQPIMLTDCYPLTYAHDATSLGPHFALRQGHLAIPEEFAQFNMWGNRGVLEWMDLCRFYCGDQPHWLTLQAFESGDGRRVRWRAPTVADLRLQTWMAVAGGAKGINYFHYTTLADGYGNPIPSVHGEHTPLLEEIARLGAELTPLGPLLVETVVSEPLSVVATLRPTADSGARIEARRLRARNRPVDYLVVLNNDVLVRSSAQINLSRAFLQDRCVYDLHALEATSLEESPGGAAFAVALEPGGGRLFAVACESDFEADARVVQEGRCRNEAAILEVDYEVAAKSGIDLHQAAALREQFERRLQAGECAEALDLIRQCAQALDRAMRANDKFWRVRQDLDAVKRTLGRLGGEPEQFAGRLSKAYEGLLRLFWEGKASSIHDKVGALRAMVGEIGATAERAPAALSKIPVDEKALERIEGAIN